MPFLRSYSRSIQKGQTLLIIILIMVVAVTVVLSIATRSITNTRISTDEESSQRAFSAAEAGVERALKTTQDVGTVTLNNNSNFNAQVINPNSVDVILNGGQTITQDEGVDLWLSTYSTIPGQMYTNKQSGNFVIRWERGTDDCTSAAIEVVALSGNDISSAKATHWAFDPCNARRSSNNFNDPFVAQSKTITTPSGSSVTFFYAGTINVTNGYIARIIPLYAQTKIGATSLNGTNLPQQGNYISSTGSSGGTTRKINVFQQYPKLPIEVFPYAIFAP